MSVASRIQQIEGHIGDIYDTLELGGDTTQNKNIVNINNEIKREYKDFLANGIEVLWNNWEKVSGSGTTLSLNNTIKGKMEIEYGGNTSQEGTPTPDSPIPINVVSGDNTLEVEGKNLAFTGWASNFVSRINDSSKASLETFDNRNCLKFYKDAGYGDYDNKYFFKTNWKENTQYTFSFDIYTLNTNGWSNLAIAYTDGTSTEISATYNAWLHRTITSTAGKTIKYLRAYWRAEYAYIDLNTFMVEEGTTASTYQPYESATYPINLGTTELCKIGDYKDRIFKTSGKNLFDGQIRQGNQNSEAGVPKRVFSKQNDLFIASGETITFSTDLDLTTFDYALYIAEKPFLTANNTMLYTSGYKTTTTFTLTAGYSGYLGFTIRYRNESNITPSDISQYHFQLEKNNQATSYEPYGTGKWYLEKNIGKVVLDGSESWSASGSQPAGGLKVYYSSTIKGIDLSSSPNLIKCNMLKGITTSQYSSGSDEGIASNLTSGNLVFDVCLLNTSLDLAGWKTLLGTTNLIFYSPLATPTYTEITGTLKDQLEEIKYSYENQTNISQTNDDLPFELDVVALSQ